MVPYGDAKPRMLVKKPASVIQRALPRIGVADTHHQSCHTIRRNVDAQIVKLVLEAGHDKALRIAAAHLGH